ncbi:hypothetical protein F3Y22_tig00109972pilonHSYRG00101 [Hibiscus syriacus]|uniref:DUF632 domain-containing protein n=1 Tax=Hibiscus syriacus TaxID=106335 RepID=A0A6A3BW49_HIBSY|nr:hypothetical protein F3Y22_tig00109972pilonHSYRG00101 [Hibiscus syriacus]
MGCVASKLEEEDEVRPSSFVVSAAIKLFVARHSSPASHFLITFPPPCPPTPPATDQNVITNTMLLQQRPLESTTHEAIACESCGSSTSSDSSDEVTEQQKQQEYCGYFYMQMPPPMPSPHRNFGWDFFNPFDVVRPEIISGYKRRSEDDLRAAEKKVVIVEEKYTKREHDESESGVLKAKEEAHSGLEGIKGEYELYSSFNNDQTSSTHDHTMDVYLTNSKVYWKLRQLMAAHRLKTQARATHVSSQKCHACSLSSRELNGALVPWRAFHILEVSYGSCSQPSVGAAYYLTSPYPITYGNKGHPLGSKSLNTTPQVSISEESISKRIQKLRDEELLPQVIELLKGEIFACPSLIGKFSNDSHRLATLQLEAELRNWRASFSEYVAAQRAYIQALHGWLTKFLVPEVEFYSRGRSSGAPYGGEEQQQKRKVDGMATELDRRTMAFQKEETRFLESKLLTEYNCINPSRRWSRRMNI